MLWSIIWASLKLKETILQINITWSEMGQQTEKLNWSIKIQTNDLASLFPLANMDIIYWHFAYRFLFRIISWLENVCVSFIDCMNSDFVAKSGSWSYDILFNDKVCSSITSMSQDCPSTIASFWKVSDIKLSCFQNISCARANTTNFTRNRQLTNKTENLLLLWSTDYLISNC